MSLTDSRRDYLGQPLTEAEADTDPFRQFAGWFEQVRDLEFDPHAMVLATANRLASPRWAPRSMRARPACPCLPPSRHT